MKIVHRSPEPKGFQPVELVLVIESEDEFKAISNMASYNLSIPRMVAQRRNGVDKEEKMLVTCFLDALRTSLHQAKESGQ